MKEMELHTIEEWADMEGVKVLDPDGFDRSDPELWEKKYTKSEFDNRLVYCTIEYTMREAKE